MSDGETTRTAEQYQDQGMSPRQRAIEAYENARDRATDTLTEAPLIALAGGIAAGALIAALLPRTETETRALRPTARRVRDTAQAAYRAAKDTGRDRLNELGINREKGEDTIRSLLQSITDAARSSGQAAFDAGRSRR